MGKRILIVDDNRLFVLLTTRSLQLKGYNVESYCSIADAEKSLSPANPPDAILLDFNIGEGEVSTDFAFWLKSIFPSSRIIIISGNSPDSSTQISELLSGKTIAAYVEKPFTLSDIERFF